MKNLNFILLSVVGLCVSAVLSQGKDTATRPSLVSIFTNAAQTPVTRPPETAVKRNDTATGDREKEPRLLNLLYSTAPPWIHGSSSRRPWSTTSPMWYHNTSPSYGWWYHHSTPPEHRHTTPWWWYHASTYPHYASTTPPWWNHASTSGRYWKTTNWNYHKTTYPYYRHTTGYPHYGTTAYYRYTTPWWHHGSTPSEYRYTTPWWYHASTYPHVYTQKSSPYWWHHTQKSTPYWWHHVSTSYPYRRTTDWWYHKTTYPYYKHTTGYPYRTSYHPYYTESTPWWWHSHTSHYPAKTTPWWYNVGTSPSPTPYWYHGSTVATSGLQNNGVLMSAVVSRCSSSGWHIVVDMLTLRHAYPNIKGSDIYLGENSCIGEENGYELVFRQNLRGCRTAETVTGENVIYRNELIYAPRNIFQRQVLWTVEVECDMGRNGSTSAHIHHDRNNSNPHVTGVGSYDVRMSFYSDSNFLHALSGNPFHVPIGTLVYTKVFTTATDYDIKMKVHDCYTMANVGDAYPVKYELIRNGCEIDSNTHFIFQSTHETRFVFQDFGSKLGQEGFDIKCDARFCEASDTSPQCLQTCNPYNIIG